MLSAALYITAGLCLLYALFLSDPKNGSPFFLVWYVIAAAFAAAGYLTAASLWQAVPSWLLIIGGVILAAAAVLLIFAGSRILSAFHLKTPEDLDLLIVLGALVHPYGPSRVLQYRLDAAAEYLKRNPRTRCIVSGGQGSNEPCPEGKAMKKYLVSKGIEAERILEENRSESTYENILFSRELCDPEHDRTAIVTNEFHLWRGMALARKAGFRHVYGLAGKSKAVYMPNNFLRECCALIKDMICGNI